MPYRAEVAIDFVGGRHTTQLPALNHLKKSALLEWKDMTAVHDPIDGSEPTKYVYSYEGREIDEVWERIEQFGKEYARFGMEAGNSEIRLRALAFEIRLDWTPSG